MKAVILLGTLKPTGQSNTEILCDFAISYIQKEGIDCEIIKLVSHNILPGTYLDMGEGDAWPAIMEKIQAADILIFATPIWWSNLSSEMQKVIERLDEVNDQIRDGKKSLLANKAGGIIVTGDSDGSQHIIGGIANFFNAVGVTLPPYCTLSVLLDQHQKGLEVSRQQLLDIYEQGYAKTTQNMARALREFVEKQAS